MRYPTSLCLILAGAASLGACATPIDAPSTATAVPLVGSSGTQVGTVRMWETPGAVSFRVEADGMAVGRKGLHVHAVGRCDAPAFTTAGSHWNPASRKHGLSNPQGPHAGDLPNVPVAANGTLRETVVLTGASLAALRDADGSALVIHAAEDDNVTDPSGNSGDRIACSVLSPAG
ncbi:superoxide dismutase family protein [Sphingomonas glaciei]|uniref:Superoxide dismutase family protein n=1 Tax=Sphingomonas glaciei TaxID=2938948 RepID=A0ABY5MYX5_9SPHN|nr:superoxide dismutase family protein [Sphingomonas glaciei]UUR08996.1 superoxide dismutase family protein [Sphingomonas glaciei]